MPLVTLQEVGQRALKDKDFFNALVKDITATLRAERLELTESDLARLEAALTGKTPGGFDLREFIQKSHAGGLAETFGAWNADWAMSWLPPGWPPGPPR